MKWIEYIKKNSISTLIKMERGELCILKLGIVIKGVFGGVIKCIEKEKLNEMSKNAYIHVKFSLCLGRNVFDKRKKGILCSFFQLSFSIYVLSGVKG